MVQGLCYKGYLFIFPENNNKITLSESIITADIIPVDLNAILYRNELNLSSLHSIVDNATMSIYYKKQASIRKIAINKYLWDNTDGTWYDFNYKDKLPTKSFYVSNYVPIWAGILNNDPNQQQQDSSPPDQQNQNQQKQKALESLTKIISSNKFPGGIPASLTKINQQWDHPNVWAPLEYFIIKSLQELSLHDLALSQAKKWIRTTYCAWMLHDHIFYEKYDSDIIGTSGHGGEYEAEIGFGWTNGLILEMLDEYGLELVVDERECYVGSVADVVALVGLICFVVLVLVVVTCVVCVRLIKKDANRRRDSNKFREIDDKEEEEDEVRL